MLSPRLIPCLTLCALTLAFGQDGLKQRREPASPKGEVQVEAGTHILLDMINSVSTKQAAVGDRIYLETAFPVMADSHIVIPKGSWVTGTITEVKRPGRMKGHGSLQVRFDSLTLPNGITRSFRSDLGVIDSRSEETLQREGSKVESPGGKKKDAGAVIGATTAGTIIGAGVGGATKGAGKGGAIGAGAGLAAGLVGVLVTRGPEAVLTKGSTVEMVLDRAITFEQSDLNFNGAPPRAAVLPNEPPAESQGQAPHVAF